MTLEKQTFQAIKASMPANANIHAVRGIKPLKVVVSWQLNDDPERPNKMSKTISISVSHEAVQDFARASATQQVAAYNRVLAFLKTKLAQFDPQHNIPRHESPPIEQWFITSGVVLGHP